MQIDQAVLGLSANYLINGFNDKIVKAYYAFMVDVAVISGADRSRAEQELKESLEFEMKLANVSCHDSFVYIYKLKKVNNL